FWARKHRMLNRAWAWSAQAQIAAFAVIAGLTVLYVAFLAIRRRWRRKRGLPVSTPPIPLQRVEGGLDRRAGMRRSRAPPEARIPPPPPGKRCSALPRANPRSPWALPRLPWAAYRI